MHKDKGVIVSIHQPNYLPYIGFFQKVALADIFVVLDTVQFSKDDYIQRVKIRTKDSSMWLTIPIERKYYFKLIKDIYLPPDKKWLKKHKKSIVSNYSRCKYFDEKFVDEYYSGNFEKLQEFNEFGIFYLKNKFEIGTKFIRASELGINEKLKSTDLLIDIMKKVKGDIYISGMGGKRYIDESKFKEADIKIEYFEFKPFEYPQRWSGFEGYMSAIDLLFNVGKMMF
ncbi:MAG: WbqC family protein [Nanoarchaeota archaeon]|nr:WbqC family protein [Nanoarchaeota archaeon]MCG2718656.1 WbqC family protein [Nanoarchaeota archaeon]